MNVSLLVIDLHEGERECWRFSGLGSYVSIQSTLLKYCAEYEHTTNMSPNASHTSTRRLDEEHLFVEVSIPAIRVCKDNTSPTLLSNPPSPLLEIPLVSSSMTTYASLFPKLQP
jgi:hypothetical protein